MDTIIVTRHTGLVEWLAAHLGGDAGPDVDWYWDGAGPDGLGAWTNKAHEVPGLTAQYGPPMRVIVNVVPPIPGGSGRIPALGHVSKKDVEGKHVIGVLPLSLAQYAASVTEIELPGLRPDQRGKELTPAEMDAAGARLGPKLVVLTTAELSRIYSGEYPG